MTYDIQSVKTAIKGPISSVRTPFTKDGDIDYHSLSRMLDYTLSNGEKAVLMTYGDSLFTLLSDKEIGELTKFVNEFVNKRAMVIACTKQWNFKQTIEFTNFCHDIDVDLMIPMPPDWTHSCSDELLYDYFSAIGEIMPFMILSNMTSGRGIPITVVEKLVENKTKGFTSVKDDMCGVYGRKLAAYLDGRYGFLSGGRAENHLDVAPYKVDGYLSMFASFDVDIENNYWNAFKSGNYEKAARHIAEVEIPFLQLTEKLNVNFDALLHACFEIKGLAQRWRRSPYSSVSDEQMELIKSFLDNIKI